MQTKRAAALVVSMSLVFSSLVRADDFDDAKRKAEDFIKRYEEIRKLNATEVRKVVKQMCDADDEKLSEVARDVADRVRSEMNDVVKAYGTEDDQEIELLNRVIADDKFKDRRSEAENYRKQVEDLWARVKVMTEAIRGGNHPVIAYLVKMGQDAHQEFPDHSGYCTIGNVPTGDGVADCLNVEKCWVIELKPNNDSAVDKGRRQAKRYSDALNGDAGGKFSELVSRNQDFRRCAKEFAPMVATYIFCPEVDDEGNFKSTSIGWGSPIQ